MRFSVFQRLAVPCRMARVAVYPAEPRQLALLRHSTEGFLLKSFANRGIQRKDSSRCGPDSCLFGRFRLKSANHSWNSALCEWLRQRTWWSALALLWLTVTSTGKTFIARTFGSCPHRSSPSRGPIQKRKSRRTLSPYLRSNSAHTRANIKVHK